MGDPPVRPLRAGYSEPQRPASRRPAAARSQLCSRSPLRTAAERVTVPRARTHVARGQFPRSRRGAILHQLPARIAPTFRRGCIGTCGMLLLIATDSEKRFSRLTTSPSAEIAMNLIRALFGEKRSVTGGKPAKARYQPAVESLEDRCLAAVDAFIWFEPPPAAHVQGETKDEFYGKKNAFEIKDF